MKMIAYVRRLIDREWIKVDWVGGQTLTHRAIALVPLAVATIVTSLQPSYSVGIAFVIVGFAGTIAVSMWIEGRRLAGTGALSTERSSRFVKRTRQHRNRTSDQEDDQRN